MKRRNLSQIDKSERKTLIYKQELIGHSKMVEALSFHPKNNDIIISVGDDQKILAWDLRASSNPIYEVYSLKCVLSIDK